MENIETYILKKCGWDEKQLGFLGTMVHNVADSKGNPIADVVCQRTNEQIVVEWFVPNKEGDKMALTYSLVENKIVKEESDSEIYNEKTLHAFLDTVANTISRTKGDFFPKCKIEVENKSKLSI